MLVQVVMMTPDEEVVKLVSRDAEDGEPHDSNDVTDAGDEPTPTETKALITTLGWNQDYNKDTRRCLNGTDWCNEQVLVPAIDGGESFYNRSVLGVTRTFIRMHLGIATLFLRVGAGFRKVRIGRVVVDNKQRLAVLRPR